MSRRGAPNGKGRAYTLRVARPSSLSKDHNSDSREAAVNKSDSVKVQPDLPFKLTGSQAKTAYALRYNADRMIREAGIGRCVFATFTIGNFAVDLVSRRRVFVQVFDGSEASRRCNNLNRRLLPEIFEKAVLVTERHKSKAIHFHLLAVLRADVDVRTGFDFHAHAQALAARREGRVDRAAERRRNLSANPELRRLWRLLRARLPGYGFGRSELTPIKKTGEAVASYVSKYVEKNLFARGPEDKGKRLVRYLGWSQAQLKASEFAWGTPRACAWRWNARQLAGMIGIVEREKMTDAFGCRWSWHVSRIMNEIVGNDMQRIQWTVATRALAMALVARAAKRWAKKHLARVLESEIAAYGRKFWDDRDAERDHFENEASFRPRVESPEKCCHVDTFIQSS